MANENTPANFLPDVIGVGFGIEFHSVGGLGLYIADHISGGNNEGVIATRADSSGIFAASHRWPEQRPGIAIWPIDIDYGLSRG